jgi:probable H4MPT-linked C1 transfer pathway protein
MNEHDTDSNLTRWLALDVGGANLKGAHSAGVVRSVAFEVWRRPDDLAGALRELAGSLPSFDRIVLTMTAELCDCYATKAEGVRAVLEAVERGVPGRPVAVWGIDGRFHEPDEIRNRPGLAAASNWLALAVAAARMVSDGRGMLIDVGSTTTDLIPLDRGKVAARGRTDTERLKAGELVYVGVRRTPVCALATELLLRGVPTGLSAELFATTHDLFLTLGDIEPDASDSSTADGRPATAEHARDRLARMVCADREAFDVADALALARSAERILMERLARSAERAFDATIGAPAFVVVAGSGEFLAARLARRLLGPDGRILSLSELWGTEASRAACAYALVSLVPWLSLEDSPANESSPPL